MGSVEMSRKISGPDVGEGMFQEKRIVSAKDLRESVTELKDPKKTRCEGRGRDEINSQQGRARGQRAPTPARRRVRRLRSCLFKCK